MRKTILIFLLLFVAWPPSTQASILELNEDSLTDLNKDWSFYKGYLVTESPKNIQGELVSLPHFWTRALTGREGFGTYTKTIILKETDIGQSFSIYIPYQATAYNLYINGEKVITQGVVHEQEVLFVPRQKRVNYEYIPQQTQLTFALQIANFTYLPGGAEKAITFGTTEAIENMVTTQNYFYIFIFGCYFILILNAFMQFIFHPKRRSFLWLGTFSLLLILWHLFSADHLIMSIFPDLPWAWLMRGEVTCSMLALAAYGYFFKACFPNLVSVKVIKGVLLFSFISAIIVLGIPVNGVIAVYNLSAIVVAPFVFYVAYVMLLAVLKKEPYSYFNLIANIIFFIAVVQDILASQALIESTNLSLIGFLSFLILNTVLLNWDHIQQYKQSEHLNNKLQQLNTALDQKVQDRTKQLQIQNKKLERLSFVDGLTDCMNRRFFDLQLEAIIPHSAKNVSLLLYDIDFFKKYNDYYGHLGGDEVLKILSATIQQALPEQVPLIRYGGEEFVIILEDFEEQDAHRLAMYLQQLVVNLKLPHAGRDDFKYVTISLGVAQKQPNETADSWIDRTDRALYHAKNTGRNRAVLYSETIDLAN